MPNGETVIEIKHNKDGDGDAYGDDERLDAGIASPAILMERHPRFHLSWRRQPLWRRLKGCQVREAPYVGGAA
ncbi:unnamed protein product [Fusarium venenatum]|uniref:Uncharacterized protein n=1 Tax=Fusarium venenatum TaxID=56646 RepID=A0A2L2T6E4_9HYPO|nr:uncharacterized protein FVRRES_12209 [Fusarium venenatum]CEI39518.1 unnamed protein product [Fusarium venenatum]